jgi:hypothetical protein
MEIVNLIGGDRRPPKQSQSYMRKRTVLRRSRGPIFALHEPVVSGRAAEPDSIAVVVGPHARECAASRDHALEVINVRGLQIRSRRLIVAAVFVEPWNRIGIDAAISGHPRLRRLLSGGSLCQEGRAQEWQGFKDGSTATRRHHILMLLDQ